MKCWSVDFNYLSSKKYLNFFPAEEACCITLQFCYTFLLNFFNTANAFFYFFKENVLEKAKC